MSLRVDVLGRDCTNGGVTSGRDAIQLNRCSGPSSDYEPGATEHYFFLEIVEEPGHGARPGRDVVSRKGDVKHVRAVPIDVDGKPMLGGMFGGHWIWTSDSRFPFHTPVPVHDRFEG
jgi:hypothetical protein